MKFDIQKNKEFGYYEVFPKPTEEELRNYYSEKYYQEENATYRASYSTEELQYFMNKISQKDFVIQSLIKPIKNCSLLDVGCGEGFTMDYYFQKGWDVFGLDFSDFGLSHNHPHLANKLTQGNVFDSLNALFDKGKQYDLLWLDNVLEHVINPQKLLQSCWELTKSGGVLVIEVPNDFSAYQKALKIENMIDMDYWVALPDHLTYFSKHSLIKLCESVSWKTHKVITDFPIEWFLANEAANYSRNKEVGKYAHQARVFIENFLNNVDDMKKLTQFYEAMGDIGQGRQLIGFFVKE